MLLIWNVCTTWWICNSTVPGGIAAMVANSFLMSLPWLAYYQVKKKLSRRLAYVALIAFWLSFEYIHLNWQLSWPWLTLGNVFASHPGWIQWYEVSGTSGGSLWIWVVNILIAESLRKAFLPGTVRWKLAIAPTIALALPFVFSAVISSGFHFPQGGKGNVVVVQPNIDPYQKFEPGMQDAQLQKMIQLSEQHIDTATRVVVWPETALNLPGGIVESRIHEYPTFIPLWNFLKVHHQLRLLTGIDSYQVFAENDPPANARPFPNGNGFYETYNAAALLDSNGTTSFYHKSKFVPGVETLPTYLRFLDSWFEQFGGTSSGYAPQEERTVLESPGSGMRIAPSICYESIYGEFMSAYARNGANVICIITNDGWWANTSGHKQHKEYARLRAIETRRWVWRSANTGISCFISPTGELFDQQPWDKAAAIKMQCNPLTSLTFYARYGDLISKGAFTLASLVLLFFIYGLMKKKIGT